MNPLLKIRERNHSPCAAPRARLVHSLLAACLLAAFHGSLAADGPVSAVQDALRREQLLSGEPSGVLDDTTRAALRRFQVRRGLPATGEIDPGTLQALQRNAEAGPPTASAQPRESVAAALAEATVERDREFLKQLESGREQVPANVEAATSPVPAPREPAAPPASAGAPGIESPRREPDAKKNRSSEKPRVVAAIQVEHTPSTQGDESLSPGDSEPETAPAPSQRRASAHISTPPAKATNSDDDADPLGSHGTRIIRSTTASAPTEKRTSTPEKKTTPRPGAAVIEVRRAEPVDPRPKAASLLHRFFRDE